jgi:hypothetical protein
MPLSFAPTEKVLVNKLLPERGNRRDHMVFSEMPSSDCRLEVAVERVRGETITGQEFDEIFCSDRLGTSVLLYAMPARGGSKAVIGV